MTLPASAAERRAAAPLTISAVQQSILLAWRSATNPLHAGAAVDRWDRQMDGWMLDHAIDPASHMMRAVSITRYRYYLLSVFHGYNLTMLHCLSVLNDVASDAKYR